jgi:hypothetical protein
VEVSLADLVDIILEFRQDPRFVTNFVTAVVRLFDHLVVLHGAYQGTHQAVVAEAQGGVLLDSAGTAFNHLGSLQESSTALARRENEIQAGLTRIARIHAPFAQRVREIVQPLLDRSASTRSIMAETEAEAAELARTAPIRLQGVRLGTGGLGPEVVRNEAALVTSQLEAQAAQLQARGIQPTLLPDASSTQQFLQRTRELANQRDSITKLTPVLAAMRAAIGRSLAQASAAGRALLSTVLEPLDVALEFLASRLGGMLTTPLLIPKGLLKSLRLEGDDTVA